MTENVSTRTVHIYHTHHCIPEGIKLRLISVTLLIDNVRVNTEQDVFIVIYVIAEIYQI